MIYCIGDSFTAGDELPDFPSDFEPTQEYPTSQLAWPALLGKKLNCKVINWGRGACSNTRIVKRTIDAVLLNDSDIIIVAWTNPLRIEMSDDKGIFDIWFDRNVNRMAHANTRSVVVKWLTANQTVELNDSWYYTNWLRQIILLQSFLNQHNKKYIMLTSHGGTELNRKYSTQHIELFNLVEAQHFLDWPNWSMMDWAYRSAKGPGGHFLEEGHNIVADKIYEHIRHFGWVS